MHNAEFESTSPSLYAWSRDARPVRLDQVMAHLDDILFGASATTLLIGPLVAGAVALM